MNSDVSIEKIYQENWKKVYNYAYGIFMQRETAEDLAAEVFLLVMEHLDSFEPGKGTMGAWIGSIAHNKVRDFLKKAYRNRETCVESLPEIPIYDAISDEKWGGLRCLENRRAIHILRQLSEEERCFLEFRYGLELNNEEIGRIIGTTANAVSHRYTRLLEKCRKLDGQ